MLFYIDSSYKKGMTEIDTPRSERGEPMTYPGRMPSIAVLGSFNMDLVVAAPRLPERGQTVLGRSFHRGPGGKGSNQAVAARRLGAEVSFIGAVGNDEFGAAARRLLAAEGVDTAGLAEVDRPTGAALIVVDDRGENQIAVAPGANHSLTPAMVESCSSAITAADVLLAQLETPLDAFLAAASIARRRGTTVILNPAPAAPLPNEAWEAIDFLTPNEHEMDELFGAGTAERGLDRCQERTAGMEVIVTRGAEGAMRLGGGRVRSYPAVPARAVDTTGAGDAFNAGLAVGMAEQGVEAGIGLGLRAGAFAVTRAGALDGLPFRADLDRAFPPSGGPAG